MQASTETGDLTALGADVEWPDSDAATAMQQALAASSHELGRLGELAEWVAGVQGRCPPRDFARIRTIVFGASVTGEGCGSLAAIEELDRSGVRPVPQREGSISEAFVAGAALADEEVDTGADLLIVALLGPDAATPVLALVSVLTNTEPVKVLTRGAGLAPEVWMQRAVTVRDARRRGMAHRAQPARLLEELGTVDVAAAAAFLLRAAARRTPVLLDGLPATTAALAAYEAQPRAVRWWHCADLSAEPAHDVAMTKLGQRSVLDLGTGLGDGTAGLLAALVLRAAIGTVAELAVPAELTADPAG
ncbi:MAG: nicotinate-nucleotide--dimethylbenzimidazole phosphoribosyltransferase [Pseudonocardiales bacterium]|nr:nicotinate-nucleotide--dimethylbenzimidazole phosphoribosyltransferase [Actinomycetota bacterium]